MNKQRVMIGTKTLDQANKLLRKRFTIATVVKLLELDDYMHYRTAYNIITADRKGSTATRPEWLDPEPIVQKAPLGWKLVGGVLKGEWQYTEPI